MPCRAARFCLRASAAWKGAVGPVKGRGSASSKGPPSSVENLDLVLVVCWAVVVAGEAKRWWKARTDWER